MPDSGRRMLDDLLLRERRLNIHAVPPEPEVPETIYRGVGAELKAERERCGLELEDVSQRLRIRVAHLRSIEEGRFGDLPGRIYAIGFLRSYAEFLGADGDVCVQLFKDEAGAGGHSKRLEFPIPQSENRRPGPLSLVVALLLAGAVYGGWHLYQNGGDQLVELVPEVPEHLVRELAERPPTEPVPPAFDATDATEMSVKPTPVVQRGPSEAVAGAAMAAESVPETTATPETTVSPVMMAPVSEHSATASPPADEAPADTVTAAAPVVAAPAAEPTSAEVPPMAVTERAAPHELALAPAVPPMPPTAQREDEYVPRVFGIANHDARIIVRATGRSQVLVKQAGGSTLLPHRVLQPGDQYRVPNLDGLVLQSDNIGALELVVDGHAIGSLGRLVDASSMLVLDPDRLLSEADGEGN